MKRNILFYVFVVLAINVFTMYSAFSYVIEFESFQKENEINLNIYAKIDDNQDFSAMDFSIVYDNNILSYINSTISQEMLDYGFLGDSNDTGSAILFSMFGLDPMIGSNSYHLGSIQFSILDSTAQQTSFLLAASIWSDAGEEVTVPSYEYNMPIDSSSAPVPLPPTIFLMGTGCILLLAHARRKSRK